MAQAPEAKLEPLRLSRVFHARCETVFKAWSTAEAVKRWFCPETFSAPDATVEMRVGGTFDVCMRSPAGEEHWVRGTFVEVTPHTRLVIDMVCTEAAGRRLFRAYTEVGFADVLGGTRMDVVQSYTMIDPSVAWMVKGAPDGWRTTLDKLEKEVVRMQGGTVTGTRSVVHATFHLERTYDAPVARVWQALTDEGGEVEVVQRAAWEVGADRTPHGRACWRQRAVEGAVGRRGGFHVRCELPRCHSKRAAGLQLCDAPG